MPINQKIALQYDFKNNYDLIKIYDIRLVIVNTAYLW